MRRKPRKQGIKSLCDNILTETARALRALFLNIVGDTKTEIDEGVTWTTGEIEGLRDVIKLYAKDAYDAAQATGSIIDPMKAMEGLSKSLKDGVLTEAQLMEMVSDIGGKLRTSQLLALINNWDMYESMLNDYRNAAGSADKEIENAMDSWTRKTNVLKNTWTEFIKTGLNSEVFKGALDFLTGFVKLLGTLQGTLGRIMTFAVAAHFHSMAKELSGVAKAAKASAEAAEEARGNLSLMAKGMEKIGISSKALNIAAGAIAAVGVAWTVYTMIAESARQKHEALVQQVYEESAAAQESSKQIFDLSAQLSTTKKGTEEFTAAAKELADALGTDLPAGADAAIRKLNELSVAQLEQNQADLYYSKDMAGREFRGSVNDNALRGLGMDNTGNIPKEIMDQWRNLRQQFYSTQFVGDGMYIEVFSVETTAEARRYREQLEKIVEATELYAARTNDTSVLHSNAFEMAKRFLDQTSEAYDKLNTETNAYAETTARLELAQMGLTQASIQNKDAYDGLMRTVREKYKGDQDTLAVMERLIREAYPQYSAAVSNAADATEDAANAAANETDALYANQKALGENASAADIAAAAQRDAEAAVRSVIPALFDEDGQLTATAKTALATSDALADMVNAQLKLQYEAANSNLINLRAQLAGVATEALKAAMAIAVAYDAANAARSMGYAVGNLGYDRSSAANGVGQAYSLLRQIEAAEAEVNRIQTQMSYVQRYSSSGSSYNPSYSPHSGSGRSSGSSGSGKSSGSSSSAKATDPVLDGLKSRLDVLKAELALMQERGDSEAKQVSKMREIEGALKNLSNYYVKIGGDQKTILDTEREWWSYENKINELLKDTTDRDKERKEAAQNRVSLLKSELALLQEKGASDAKQIAKMREIQDALHDEAELLRELGGDQEEINGLSREWYSYRNKINDMLSQQAEEAETLASNLRDAVEAQKALNNAQNERNAHVYNKASGQWEWAANPKNLLSAQESLYNALQKLPGQEQIPYIRALNSSLAANNIPGQMGYVYPTIPEWTGSIGIPATERVRYLGDTYNFSGLSLTESMAKTTTLYELAQMAKNLVIYNHSA